jgi:hypothetical protein
LLPAKSGQRLIILWPFGDASWPVIMITLPAVALALPRAFSRAVVVVRPLRPPAVSSIRRCVGEGKGKAAEVWLQLSGQVAEHGMARSFGLRERSKGRATQLDCGRIAIELAPGGHEAGASVKAGTAPALVADNERKAVAGCAPDFHVLDGTNDAAEVQGHFATPPPNQIFRDHSKGEQAKWEGF